MSGFQGLSAGNIGHPASDGGVASTTPPSTPITPASTPASMTGGSAGGMTGTKGLARLHAQTTSRRLKVRMQGSKPSAAQVSTRSHGFRCRRSPASDAEPSLLTLLAEHPRAQNAQLLADHHRQRPQRQVEGIAGG